MELRDGLSTKSQIHGEKILEVISEINIFNVQHSDAGKYQCIVSNAYGTTYSQKTTISVCSE